ncbi:MAG: YIP1 family protein [Clostridia bacterium]|nr:YIP1 family protein [Clostridia bacterium]
MKRLLSIICIILVLTIGFSLSVLAEPTDAFTHEDSADGTVKGVLSSEMYNTSKFITASTLGLEKSLLGISDVCTGNDGKVYLLVSERSKVIVLNSDYTLNCELSVKDSDGMDIMFDSAKGIFVDKNNDIYICATGDGRILVTDLSGNLKSTWETPESSLLPEDFYFQPSKMVRDDKGYTYILSLGCYYGALAYSPDNEFIGFYGSNNVKASALDTLEFLWNKLTQTDEKKSKSVKSLPYSFVDLCLDSKGYMITCTGLTESDKNGTGQIRKLSPGGEDILYKRNTKGISTTSSSVNFVEEKVTKRFGVNKPQNIIAVEVDENGFIYALDSTHGLIYIYDKECNLLAGFGGGYDYATQKGIFDAPVSLAIHGTDILVIDKDNNALTVFERTTYGQLLMDAQIKHLNGEYDKATPIWEQVITINSGCQLAYRGLAIANYTNGNYEKALEYAEKGLDYKTYDLAWKVIFSKWVDKNFVWIFSIVLLFIIALVAFLIIKKKKGIVLIKNPKLKLALSITSHPFRSFEDIRYKNMGSIPIALVLLLLYYVSNMLNETSAGFLFLNSDPKTYNTLYTILSTIGLILLWSVANWLIACLSSGKGRFRDVFIVSCYCTLPLTVFKFVRVILSQFLSLSGQSVVDSIGVAVIIFTLFILCIGIMQVHEFDFFKFLTTTIVTILFMLLIVSVLLLVGVLLEQVGEFIIKLYREAVFR